MTKPRIALVIGSGSLKCAAAVGLWKVLEREGIKVDMVVGCSGGSIYASLMALQYTASEVEERHSELWCDLFRRKNLQAIAQLIFGRAFGFREEFGLVDDTPINTVLRTYFGSKSFSDAAIPLYIVATDLRSGEKVELSQGNLFDAIRASIAIPFALRPWTVGERLLIDGGASDPLPVDVAIREGADIIVAMGFENPTVPVIDSPAKLILQTSSITVNHLLRSTFAFYSLAHHAEVIPVIPQFDQRIGLGDTHLMQYIVEQGERAAEREVSYLKRLLEQKSTA